MANIKGKGKLYKGQYGWSISQSKKDKDGKDQIFYIPVRFIKNALQRVADRKFIEFEGFTNHYKTKDGKTMTDYVITHIIEKDDTKGETTNGYAYDKQIGLAYEKSMINQNDNCKPLMIDSDDLPF